MEFGETAEEALVREVKEETGCESQIIRLLVVHQNFFKGDGRGKYDWHELSFYYLTDLTGAVRADAQSDCAFEYLQWIPIKKYATFNAFPRFFKDLDSILKSPVPLFLAERG